MVKGVWSEHTGGRRWAHAVGVLAAAARVGRGGAAGGLLVMLLLVMLLVRSLVSGDGRGQSKDGDDCGELHFELRSFCFEKKRD